MGYTNYWATKKLKEGEIPAQFWKDAEEILDMIISKGVILATGDGEVKLKTGHDIINQTTMTDIEHPSIVFNGYCHANVDEDESYETFVLVFDGKWTFCKTARMPYDLAVKCILMLAEQYDLLSPDREDDGSKWSFDGFKTDEEYIEASAIMTAYKIKKQLNK